MSLSRRRFLLAGAAAVGSAAALSAACTPAARAPQATVAPTIAPAAGAPLKIGVLLPYTESSIGVDIGLNQKRAADLYLKQHDGKLGGRAVKLVYAAESIEAPINKTKVTTLLKSENVELLLGGAAAETAYVMRDAADAAKLVYIASNATANALTRSVADCKPSCKSQYVFRASASSWQLSYPLGDFVSRQGATDFFVCSVDDVFGSESADAFVAGLTRHGATTTARASLPSGGDWASAIASIKAQPTRNVFAAFQTDDADGFLDEWAKQGLPRAGFQLYGPGFLVDVTQAAPDGATTSHFWSPDLDNPENKALVDQFPREYTDEDTGAPVPLNGYAVAMWDTIAALDMALRQSGGDTSPQSLVPALEGVSFSSPRGAFAFDKNSHNPVQDILIRQTKAANGKLTTTVVDRVPRVADPG